MAVTQNYVSPANLDAAVQWQALGAGGVPFECAYGVQGSLLRCFDWMHRVTALEAGDGLGPGKPD